LGLLDSNDFLKKNLRGLVFFGSDNYVAVSLVLGFNPMETFHTVFFYFNGCHADSLLYILNAIVHPLKTL
jgi:hypothetical protein